MGQKLKRAYQAKKARKLAKPENCPKRPPSSYFLWLGANRAELTKECEGMTGRMAPHVMRLAGKRWAALTEADKEPFVAEALERKAAYTEAMIAWRETDECKDYEASKKATKAAAKAKKKAASKIKGKKKRGRPKKITDAEGEEWVPG